MVSIDAAIVLSEALLTAYVGTTGLVKRLALDRCLPQPLLKENRWRHTSHRIIIAFSCCAPRFFGLLGDMSRLSRVFTRSLFSALWRFSPSEISFSRSSAVNGHDATVLAG
jgi:hypothetical protein